MKKVTDLPDKNKRPKNKPRKQIKVNSFATAMLAKAEQDKYKGPQAVDENGHTKEDPKEKYENGIRNLQNNLETMKSKDRFSKAVKEYNENFGEFEEFNIDDIQRDIDNEFNASNAKLEEQSDTLDLDEIENTSNFEELWGKE